MNEIISLLSGVPIGGLGFGGLVTVAIVMIFRGDIVPKTTLDKMQSYQDKILATKDEENATLKEALRISEQARSINEEALPELLEMARTTVHLLEAIHERADRAGT